ncbi:MAG: excinuclease ABC subunit UvrC [Spirochaetaceae bacterium]|jgi:excinuclease ABC subunit C|nr:excinuclease ABC subunit UvrC [Spirochaetaceae bacterium]
MDLKKIARDAPQEPGVYIMRDEANRIIYVGKARILRNRLSSYFSGEKDIKTSILVRHAASIETIIVKDEYEALLLENTLIKQHSPKYNISLKDGKTYPVIRLTGDSYPRIFRTRHIIEDGSSYFGPFANVGAMDGLLSIIDRVFPLLKCRIQRKRTTPCMYYHIGRCHAPCCGRITEAAYSLQVSRVRKLLSGNTEALVEELAAEMRAEAKALRYERAGQLRDALKAIEGLSESSVVIDFDPQGRDYIAWASGGVLATFSVFSMRQGRLTGRELYRTKSASDAGESLVTFMAGYYNGERLPPGQIYLAEQKAGPPDPARKPDSPGGDSADFGPLRMWFREQFGLEPELILVNLDEVNRDEKNGPANGDRHHRSILAMTRQNAEEDLRRRLKERGTGPALDELKAALGLQNRPERIEGFDIAQLDGKHPVASLVSFANGAPDKKNYRYFKLRTTAGIVDDFQSMREAVERRYRRLLKENRELPDLILIDGGIGQVNAAKGVLEELGIDCDIAGLAKRDEEIWLPNAGEPVRLDRRSEALKVLQFVRDETHRFATGLNQRLRSGDLKLEALESVEGIGPRRAAALIRYYQGIEGIAGAEPEDIARACGCGIAAARAARAAVRLAAVERKRSFTPGSRGLSGRRSAGKAAALADAALAAPYTPENATDAGSSLAAEPAPDYGEKD